jgi:hypothetical protein
VNISNITVGDIIHNYPKMCELLNQPIKKGRPRDRQIVDWERFIKFEKQGHKFKILEIYPTEIPKVDGRKKGNNSKYVTYTSKLLLYFIYSYIISDNISSIPGNEQSIIELTNKKIKAITGLCNESFIINDEHIFEELYSNNTITKYDKNNFYRRANSKMAEIIKTTFKFLNKNNNDLSVNTVHILTDNIKGIHKNINEVKNYPRTANRDEENIIARTKILVLNEYNIKDISIIYLKGLQDSFYKRVNELLYQNNKWAILYKTNEISYNDNLVSDIENYMITEEEQQEYLSIVNKSIHKFLDTQAENAIIKLENKIQEYDERNNTNAIEDDNKFNLNLESLYDGFNLPDNYVEKQKILSNLLIKLYD